MQLRVEHVTETRIDHMRKRHRTPTEKRGIGIYSYDQNKNMKPVGYAGAILIGAFYLCWGLSRLYGTIMFRRAETKAFGSPEPHVGAFIIAFSMVIFGAFVGHAGLIYYLRKIRFRSSSPSSRELE